ncbi:MAG: hypothetical protein IPM08_00920 [Actinomycetales bacterium]|nr:hypothetical protein [Actinomycetales bacterium]
MPVGWVQPTHLSTAIGSEHLHRGGTVARRDSPPRAYLDAALSSPSGRGVIVAADGRLAGTVTAGEVVAALPHGIPGAYNARGFDVGGAPPHDLGLGTSRRYRRVCRLARALLARPP